MQKKSTVQVSAICVSCRVLPLLFFTLLSLFTVTNLYAQSVRVSGVIKDASGAAVSGASVNVKGSSIGTVTDTAGRYSLTVPSPSSVLVFSSVGFGSVEQQVGTKRAINVSLASAVSNLDEVIVVGYGTQKKRDVTGSISSVSAKDIQERNPTTLFDALQGKAAGVLITSDNGDPAGQGTIQIRGASTINSGNGPLYVIDGIISENGNFLNPSDIESIDILKDVASTAIYGARGANGVILITTKKGKEGRPLLSLNYYRLYGQLAHKLRTTNSNELRYYRAQRGDGNSGYNVDSLNPYLNADNDYQDLLFRTGVKQVASVSIGGGQKGLSYYGGLTYTDDQSIVLNSWVKRVQSKINVSYKANEKLTVSNSLAFAYQTGNSIPVGNTAKQVFERNPWTSIYRPDGTLAGFVESKRNPVAQALYNVDLDNNYTVQYNMQGVYKFTKDLQFTTLFNAQLDNNTNRTLTPDFLNSNNQSTGGNTFNKNFYWEYQAYLNYNKKLGDHSLSGTAVFSADRRRVDEIRIGMLNYLDQDLLLGNIATIDLTTAKTYTTATAYSDANLTARVGDTYKGKYIVQGTFRRDASSRFGPKNRWGNFYSGSAAWRFSSEKFMDWAHSWLTDGKLRISYGKAGNDRIGNTNYPSYTVITFGQNYYNGYGAASESTQLGNSEIHWESTTSVNYGLDLTLLKNRLNITADYYTKTTDNLLYGKKLPVETGKTDVNINLGSIVNKGLELSAIATPITTKNFRWDVTGNISFQNAYIKELANHTSFISGNKWLIREGGKIGDFYVWKNLGVYQWDESNAYDANGSKLSPDLDATGKPTGTYTLDGKPYTGTINRKSRNGFVLQGGDTEWQDVNNDGIIDEQDKVIAGNGLPDYFYGIGSTLTYKNWSLNFLFNGQVGNDIYNNVRNAQNNFSSTYTPPIWDAALYSWHQPGDVSQYPYFQRKDTRGSISTGYNSLYIEDGSFLRLSSVRLAYTLGARTASKIKMKSAQLYVYGNNLLTWTDYSWYDPEFSSSGLNIGEDNGKYPKRRELGAGININF
jgi:TonB-dependent starch-binding outer membrane protein SusC